MILLFKEKLFHIKPRYIKLVKLRAINRLERYEWNQRFVIFSPLRNKIDHNIDNKSTFRNLYIFIQNS